MLTRQNHVLTLSSSFSPNISGLPCTSEGFFFFFRYNLLFKVDFYLFTTHLSCFRLLFPTNAFRYRLNIFLILSAFEHFLDSFIASTFSMICVIFAQSSLVYEPYSRHFLLPVPESDYFYLLHFIWLRLLQYNIPPSYKTPPNKRCSHQLIIISLEPSELASVVC